VENTSQAVLGSSDQPKIVYQPRLSLPASGTDLKSWKGLYSQEDAWVKWHSLICPRGSTDTQVCAILHWKTPLMILVVHWRLMQRVMHSSICWRGNKLCCRVSCIRRSADERVKANKVCKISHFPDTPTFDAHYKSVSSPVHFD
jgi:hypothetical protein